MMRLIHFLKQLEKLHFIRLVQNKGSAKKLSERFAGKLSSVEAEKLQEHISKSRAEWNT